MGRFGLGDQALWGLALGALFLASLFIGLTSGPSTSRPGAVHDAVRAGNVAAVDMLLAGGADIEETEYAQARSGFGAYAEIAQILQAQAAR